ncbi:MAG: membrane protein insertase YidC, partial [Proteobacteria bacterium]|nr:membrane protein insertase YidC [Pseudomonadota bacterium]
MDNEKRILLAVALSIAVLFGYQYLFTPATKKIDRTAERTSEQAEKPAPAVVQPQAAITTPQSVPAQQATAANATADISIDTALFTAQFSSATAGPASFQLHNYRESLEPTAAERLVEKIFPGESAPPAGASQKHKELVHARTVQELPLRTLFADTAGSQDTEAWQADKNTLKLSADNRQGELTFHQQDSKNLEISKRFTFSDQDYQIGLQLSLKNNSAAARTGSAVIEWKAHIPSQKSGGFFSRDTSNVAQLTYFLKDKVVKEDLTKIKGETPIEGDIGWTAIEEKYFMSALLFHEQKPAQVR